MINERKYTKMKRETMNEWMNEWMNDRNKDCQTEISI